MSGEAGRRREVGEKVERVGWDRGGGKGEMLWETSITVLSDCSGTELSKRSSGLFLCTVGT